MAVKKKAKSKPLFQWCIKETYVNEVLELPKDLNITSITFEIGFSLKRVVSTIPEALREMGVSSLREPSASMEAFGTLIGSRAKMMANARAICRELQLDFRHMRVRRMTVAVNGTQAFFTRMTKNMDTGEENKTHRVKVLGLVKFEGTETGMNKIVRLLTAKKIQCTYTPKTVMEVLCTE